jgi:hypothetical protein
MKLIAPPPASPTLTPRHQVVCEGFSNKMYALIGRIHRGEPKPAVDDGPLAANQPLTSSGTPRPSRCTSLCGNGIVMPSASKRILTRSGRSHCSVQ